MDVSGSRIWTCRYDKRLDTPFRTGIDRALAIAFPPMHGGILPDRIIAALLLLEAPTIPQDRRQHLPGTLPPEVR